MADKTEILTSSEVVTNVIPDAQIDVALFDNQIFMAQRKYLRPFLGEDFYDEILSQTANTATLTADNQTLINDWLKPMLSHYVVYEALPFVRNQLTSQGVSVQNTEFANAASQSDYSSFRSKFISDAEWWKAATESWIEDQQEDDSTKYPDFCNGGTKNNKGGIILY